MKKRYFITGIGTGVGKTVTSAAITEKLKADYWKPIQSGDLEQSDSLAIKSLIANKQTVIHPERYRLNQPLSPHLSAKIDGIDMLLSDFELPHTDNHLIVEGAGGLMVPINNNHLIIDLIKHLALEVILVSQNYLGSINHTLLSIAMLKNAGIELAGIIFCGEKNEESERYILTYSNAKLLGNIPQLSTLNASQITQASEYLNV